MRKRFRLIEQWKHPYGDKVFQKDTVFYESEWFNEINHVDIQLRAVYEENSVDTENNLHLIPKSLLKPI